MKYRNGYSDGSGKGIITMDDKALLATHWGCSCCDTETTEENNILADKIVKMLNKRGLK